MTDMLTLANRIMEKYPQHKGYSIKLLRETDYNAVYLIENSNLKRVLRISKRTPFNDIKYELEAIGYLKDNNYSVAFWENNNIGEDITVLDKNVFGVLFEYIEGDHVEIGPDIKPKLKYIKVAGETLGKLHSISQHFSTQTVRSRNIYTELERAINYKNKFTEEFEGGKVFVSRVKAYINFAKNSTAKSGLINNDYRVGNVIFNSKGNIAAVIDFDWCCVAPLIKDLALGVVEWSFPDGNSEPWEDLFDEFLESYNLHAPESINKNEEFYRWIAFACLSDACTYFCDLIEDPESTKRAIRSYMYTKFRYFNSFTNI